MVGNSSGHEIKMSAETSVFLAIFTSAQTFIGSLANIIVIITVVASRELRRRSEDRLILNLAVADLLAVTVFLPLNTFVLSQRYITIGFEKFYETLNTLVWANGGNSIFAIGIDTFVAVVFPLRHKKIMTNRATFVTIILSWGMAFAIAVVQFLEESSIVDRTTLRVLLIACSGSQHFGVALLYIIIYYYTRKQVRAILNETRNFAAESGLRSRRVVLKSAMTTLGLALLYYVTSLPFAIYFVYCLVGRLPSGTWMSNLCWINSFLFVNSCVNPFAYALRTKRFRTAFHKKIYSKIFRRHERLQRANNRVRYIVDGEEDIFLPEI